mgnify:FL=1
MKKFLSFIVGGIALVFAFLWAMGRSSKSKKEYKQSVKDNENKIKEVKKKGTVLEKKKKDTKATITATDKKIKKTKAKVKSTKTAKKTISNFEGKYRKK